jgi:hypothetical protein
MGKVEPPVVVRSGFSEFGGITNVIFKILEVEDAFDRVG